MNRGRKALVAWMGDNMINAAAMARRLGVAPITVYGWTAGRRRPSLARALAIEQLTGIPAAAWVEGGR